MKFGQRAIWMTAFCVLLADVAQPQESANTSVSTSIEVSREVLTGCAVRTSRDTSIEVETEVFADSCGCATSAKSTQNAVIQIARCPNFILLRTPVCRRNPGLAECTLVFPLLIQHVKRDTCGLCRSFDFHF